MNNLPRNLPEMQFSNPITPTATPAGSPPPAVHSRRRWLWWSIIGILVVGLFGGGYFAYSRGYISIPFLSPNSEDLVQRMFDSLDDIESAQYSVKLGLKTEPRNSAYQPFVSGNQNSGDLFEDILDPESAGVLGAYLGLFNPDTVLSLLPTDVNLEAGTTFYFQSNTPVKDANALLSLDGTYTGGDISVAFDVELRKVKENVYVVVRRFPSLGGFFDLSTIKEKWIAITPDDTSFFKDDVIQNADANEATAGLRRAIQLAIEHNVYDIGSKRGTDTIAGVRSNRYEVQLNVEQLVPMYEAMLADAKSDAKDTAALEKVLTSLREPKVMEYFEGIAKNSLFEVWIDVKDGFLRQTHWRLVVVPPTSNERLRDKQVSVDITLTLDKVNQDVQVERPSETIDYDEAARLITGISQAQQSFEKQRSRVSEIRSALSFYQGKRGEYPASLTELNAGLEKILQDCRNSAANTNTSTDTNTAPTPPGGATVFSIEQIPSQGGTDDADSSVRCYSEERYEGGVTLTDIYTNQPYPYARNDNDYTLKYEMEVSDDVESYYLDEHVNGTNTATSQDISLEKETEYEQLQATNTNTSPTTSLYSCFPGTPSTTADSDEDGLTDYQEVDAYKTDPCDADTDGDGYQDGEEINNGFDPRGTGKLESVSVSQVVASNSGKNVTISWQTNVKTTGTVHWGDSAGSYWGKFSDFAFDTSHSITYEIGEVGKTYHYQIEYCQTAGVCSSSADFSYTLK